MQSDTVHLYSGMLLAWTGALSSARPFAEHMVPSLAPGDQFEIRFTSQDPNHFVDLKIVNTQGELCECWQRRYQPGDPYDQPEHHRWCVITHRLTGQKGHRFRVVVGGELLNGSEEVHYTIWKQLINLPRQPWLGSHVALLVPSQNTESLPLILKTLDDCYTFYHRATGYIPHPFFTYANRLSVAVVSETCGAGCGYLGATGIEADEVFWKAFYTAVQVNSLWGGFLFYELGRNFWAFGNQVEAVAEDPPGTVPGTLCTAFAVFMRNAFIQYQGLPSDPPRPTT